MSNFIDRMFGRNKGSGATAKDRLQFLLIHDRINLPPEQIREMKEEILRVISKYVSVDPESVDIALEQRDRNDSRIIAEIPFSGRQVQRDRWEGYEEREEAPDEMRDADSVASDAAPHTEDDPSTHDTVEVRAVQPDVTANDDHTAGESEESAEGEAHGEDESAAPEAAEDDTDDPEKQ